MASPFQQQARQRKLVYLALILVLFTLSLIGRRWALAPQAQALAIREETRGEVDLTGAAVRLGLIGSRGVATCYLRNSAMEKQKKNQWNELEVRVRSLTKLQPHFITPWLFQSWNLAYNVSVESDRIRDKYFYISRGIELLGEGERQNRDHPDLRWSIGFYTQHKIMQSDETNYLRSLFQLSTIPPSKRDPARFWKPGDEGPELNWVEFEKFCHEQPQLVRRLREGIHRDNVREKKRLFECPTPADVVRFLDENYRVPSIYQSVSLPLDSRGQPVPAYDRRRVERDDLAPPEARFPVLPPPPGERHRPSRAFDSEALHWQSSLDYDIDGYRVAHAWFCYAQEPLPEPGDLPGSSQPIGLNERARKRRPKNMTTLIFRSYPAQGRRYIAERLQDEGWFDEENWDISDWFLNASAPTVAGKTVQVGGGRKWSLRAWQDARRAWEKHGLDNRLLFSSDAQEQRVRDQAERFARRQGLRPGMPMQAVRQDRLSDSQKADLHAFQFLSELEFYRTLSNYMHHLNRVRVEANETTVTCRKFFDRANQLSLAGESLQALELYRKPVREEPDPQSPGKTRLLWDGKTLSPLQAWRELVLLKNKEFRRDSFNQELNAEIQLRYLILYNRQEGRDLKRQLARAAGLVPLLPRVSPETFRPPIVEGPFDGVDDEGVPLIDDNAMTISMSRMGLPTRRTQPGGPPPGMMRPGMPRPGPDGAPPPPR